MRNILRSLKPNRFAVALAIILMLSSSGLQLILPLFMQRILNNGVQKGDVPYIYGQGAQMIAISLAAMCVALLSSYFTSKVSMNFGMHLRQRIFYRTQTLNKCDVDKIGTPSLITRSTNDVNQIQGMVLAFLRTLITTPIIFIGATIMAFTINTELAMLLIYLIPIIGIGAFIVSRTVMPLFKKMQKRTDALNKILREKLSGIRIVRAFNRSEHEDERFRLANLDLTMLALRVQRLMALLMPLATLLISMIIVVMVRLEAGKIGAMDPVADAERIQGTVGDMFAFITYFMMALSSIIGAVELFFDLPRASVSAKRINEVLLMDSQIREPDTPLSALPQGNNPERGHLQFRDVAFRYNNEQGMILQNISFETFPGETTAIVGSTGSGKSSLVNLIPRFYDAVSGSVRVNGMDVRDMRSADLRQTIGFIPQQAFLFSGTVADNLRFGKEDATEDEIWEALRIAQAEDFVQKLPLGLYDMISQSGKNLSGGQKQRLAIARAIIRKSDIYVFDDSFSALDYTTDAKLRHALRDAVADSTVIIVAQRIGTIMNADRILVLEQGKIVGQGKHRELLENCPTYREIALSQLPAEELAI